MSTGNRTDCFIQIPNMFHYHNTKYLEDSSCLHNLYVTGKTNSLKLDSMFIKRELSHCMKS